MISAEVPMSRSSAGSHTSPGFTAESGNAGHQDGGSVHVYPLRCGSNAAVGTATGPGRKRDSRCRIIAQLQKTDTALQRWCVDRRRLSRLLGITA
jgi:hypothetical protein